MAKYCIITLPNKYRRKENKILCGFYPDKCIMILGECRCKLYSHYNCEFHWHIIVPAGLIKYGEYMKDLINRDKISISFMCEYYMLTAKSKIMRIIGSTHENVLHTMRAIKDDRDFLKTLNILPSVAHSKNGEHKLFSSMGSNIRPGSQQHKSAAARTMQHEDHQWLSHDYIRQFCSAV